MNDGAENIYGGYITGGTGATVARFLMNGGKITQNASHGINTPYC